MVVVLLFRLQKITVFSGKVIIKYIVTPERFKPSILMSQ